MLYKKSNNGSSIEVKETSKGYVVKINSNYQGGWFGRKLFISFAVANFAKGTDLNADFNDYATIGDTIATTAIQIDNDKEYGPISAKYFRVLNKGVKIQ
jgi:hypothetical protein